MACKISKNMTFETEIQQDEPNKYKRFFKLGLPNALLTFAHASTGVIFADLIVYRAHAIAQKINSTESFVFNTTSPSPEFRFREAEIERYANVVLMTKSLIDSIIPTLLSIFIGPWSEQGGRRPLLLAGCTGYSIMYGILSFMCNWDIEPWYLLLPAIISQLMGGQCIIILASNCYISDTTTPKDRTVFLACLQMFTFTGVLLGIISVPFLSKHYGYAMVFTVATICCTSALLHIYFFIPESVKDTSKASLQTVFQISFLKEIVTVCVFKRDGLHRLIVWLALFIFTVSVMVNTGDINQIFLFVRARLFWDVQDLSYLSSGGLVISVAGLCGVSLLNPILGIPDTWLGFIGLVSTMGSLITKSLTWKSWHLYLSVVIGLLSGLVGPVMRSIITKFIPAQDVGKVFSLMALMETLCPLIGAPLFTLVYTSYLPPIYPCPLYLLMASLFAISAFCIVYMEVLIKRSPKMPYIPAAQEEKL